MKRRQFVLITPFVLGRRRAAVSTFNTVPHTRKIIPTQKTNFCNQNVYSFIQVGYKNIAKGVFNYQTIIMVFGMFFLQLMKKLSFLCSITDCPIYRLTHGIQCFRETTLRCKDRVRMCVDGHRSVFDETAHIILCNIGFIEIYFPDTKINRLLKRILKIKHSERYLL